MTTAKAIPDQLIRCDLCQLAFAQSPATFVEVEGDVETVGIECPHCRHRVTAFRTNGAIRALQAKVRKEAERFRAKIAAGVPPNKAERKLRQAKKQLERAFKAYNQG